MSENVKVRRYARRITAAAATIAAAAGSFFAVESSANAADWGATCNAVAVNFAAPSPLVLADANPANYPCNSDSKTVVNANATLVPGVLGVGATKISVSGVTSSTYQGWAFDGGYEVHAQSDIASLTITGPGLLVKATGVHSDATILDGASYAHASIATLTVNGSRVNVAKNTPLTIPVGLRIAIYVDATDAENGLAFGTPLAVTFPDKRYSLSLADSTVTEVPLD